MKISAGENSLAYRAIVLLDGVSQKDCTHADEERGFVIRYVQPLRLNQITEDFDLEIVSGTVQIIDPYDPPMNLLESAYLRCDRE